METDTYQPEQEITGQNSIPDEDLEAMKQRIKEMEEEAQKIKEMQAQVEKEMNLVSDNFQNKELADSRSIYIGNVDYSATPEELQEHFQACGTINRVTILCDKFSGHPKGFAYLEFADPSAIANAMALNESLFKGRLIKVTTKRTNYPGLNRGRGRGRFRARGFRGSR